MGFERRNESRRPNDVMPVTDRRMTTKKSRKS